MNKQKKAFLNIHKNGCQRSELLDRIQCSENFKNTIKENLNNKIEMKGKRIGLNQFTVEAFDLINRKRMNNCISENLQLEMDLLNSQWRDNATQTKSLCSIIPMVDFSGSMDGAPRDCAFALGCRVAEKSLLGKRVLSFSKNPTWHNLENCNNFIEMVEVLQNGEVGFNTNFYRALKVILDAIIEKKLQPDEVSDMVLAIFSDMQIDEAEGNERTNMDCLYETIESMYYEAGMRIHNVPFKPPHILFWNLRSTNGFPVVSYQKNVSMMSGFSPALLNIFCEKGIDVLQSCTPWSILMDSLNNPRYQCLQDKIVESFLVL
jgi:hypothetical protein